MTEQRGVFVHRGAQPIDARSARDPEIVAAKAVYDARSPLNHLEGFRAPLIIFQGAEDPIVPPNQAHMILDALRDIRLSS